LKAETVINNLASSRASGCLLAAAFRLAFWWLNVPPCAKLGHIRHRRKPGDTVCFRCGAKLADDYEVPAELQRRWW
jgi:hypothetical protein